MSKSYVKLLTTQTPVVMYVQRFLTRVFLLVDHADNQDVNYTMFVKGVFVIKECINYAYMGEIRGCHREDKNITFI